MINDTEFITEISSLEIYCEQIRDLYSNKEKIEDYSSVDSLVQN